MQRRKNVLQNYSFLLILIIKYASAHSLNIGQPVDCLPTSLLFFLAHAGCRN